MCPTTRLLDIIVQWEELRDQGYSISASELCRDCPELIEEVQAQINDLRKMDWLEKQTLGGNGSLRTSSAQGVPGSRPDDPFFRAGAEPVPGYKLVRPLGQGGFGEVWQANGPGNFQVALKFIRHGGKNAMTEKRGLSCIKDIRHPNLLAMFGAWFVDDFLIIAMELADRTLMDRFEEAIKEGLPGIPRPESLEYFLEAAKGIDFLNEPRHILADSETHKGKVGIQHRDIKPQNLLLVGGCVKVGDFGLARVLENAVTGHTGRMTAAFAAPEFFDGKTTRQSDQYCLAISYCLLLGGRLPFTGNSAQVMAGQLQRPPDLTMLPFADQPIVARALAKQPADRWPSCRAFVEALQRGKSPDSEENLVSPAAIVPAANTKAMGQIQKKFATLRRGITGSPRRRYVAVSSALMAAVAVLVFLNVRRPTDPETQPVHAAASEVIAAPATVPVPVTKAVSDETKVPSAPALARLKTYSGHTGAVESVAFTPDGQRFLSASWDRTVILWDVNSGERLRVFKGHTDKVHCVAIAPDCRLAASAGFDNTVRLWDFDTGNELRCFRGHQAKVSTVVFTADQRHLLSAGGHPNDPEKDYDLHFWEIATGKEVRAFKGHIGPVWSVTVTPDGLHALSASLDGTLRLWDIGTGKELRCFKGHSLGVFSLALSRDGLRALSGSADKTVRLWDVKTGNLLRTFSGHRETVATVAFSPDGHYGASAGDDGSLRLWSLESGQDLCNVGGQSIPIWTLKFSPDGRHVLSGSKDGNISLRDMPNMMSAANMANLKYLPVP